MDKEKRVKELQDLFEGVGDIQKVVDPLIQDTVYLEEQLEYLRTLPKIRVNSKNSAQQETTPAAKLYKELLQQYNNIVKILTSILRKDAPEEESPLRAYLNSIEYR